MPFDTTWPPLDADAADRDRAGDGAVAAWLMIVAAMIVVMIALGGATRLTGSGLSIMEWRPLTGWLPPLSEAEWNRLFALYRTIPQYLEVNRGMDLAGFKEIFWLEYLHRLWGKLIGVAFAGGAILLALTGRLRRSLWPRIGLLFGLGALQGLLGWFMVASGFFPHRTAVSPYRLTMHLGLAFVIFAAVLWTALDLLRPARRGEPPPRALKVAVHAAGGFAVLTMLAGGFVAGTRAGFTFNTFPLMDGRLFPAGYADLSPFVLNFFENLAAVQFNHRLLATLALVAAVLAGALALRAGSPWRLPVLGLSGAIVLQYVLGIATLLAVVPVSLGTLHQTMAVLVLGAFVIAAHRVRRLVA
ncbi:COX15/CtaA family protein [Elioraea rosea]|uniref:COX15/CtaA family protein n=1 Tax=Elioraea rosea TaxID=2492390 RepID=UPI001183851F|nr:COX15/CtaA family protein [Elioraea rosea]